MITLRVGKNERTVKLLLFTISLAMDMKMFVNLIIFGTGLEMRLKQRSLMMVSN